MILKRDITVKNNNAFKFLLVNVDENRYLLLNSPINACINTF